MNKYIVNGIAIRHNGKRFKPGSILELEAEEAKRIEEHLILLEDGSLSEIETPTLVDIPTETEIETPTLVEVPTETETETPTLVEVPTETETETPTLVNVPTETETETETVTPTVTETKTSVKKPAAKRKTTGAK
jgi:hypothetical protein